MAMTDATPTGSEDAADFAPTFARILLDARRGDDPAVDRVLAAADHLRSAELEVREAVAALGGGTGGAWARFGRSADATMVEMEVELTVAAASLRADVADTREEVHSALEQAADAIRGRIDELRVRAHLGELDLRAAAEPRLDAVGTASKRLGDIIATAEHETGESLAQVRTVAGTALTELRRSFADLSASLRPPPRPHGHGGPTSDGPIAT